MFLTRRHETDVINNVNIERRHGMNTSPHDPVIAEITFEINDEPPKVETKFDAPTRVNWTKVNLKTYEDMIDKRLKMLGSVAEMHTQILVNRVNAILVDSTLCTGGRQKKVKKRK